jgi:hypothetical protein
MCIIYHRLYPDVDAVIQDSQTVGRELLRILAVIREEIVIIYFKWVFHGQEDSGSFSKMGLANFSFNDIEK